MQQQYTLIKKGAFTMIGETAKQIQKYEERFHEIGSRTDVDAVAERAVLLKRIAELKQLPANRPLTQPGQHLGGGGYTGGRSSDGPFRSLGEQLQSVMKAGMPGEQADQRLFDVRAASGLNETTPSEGAFLVQQDFSSELITSVFQSAILAPKCRRIQISQNANGLKMNGIDETSRVSGSRGGGIQSYWVAEAAQITASKPKFRQLSFDLKKLVGLVYVTDELLADSAALEGVVRQAFVNEFAYVLDEVVYRGSGAGQPLGLLHASSLVTVSKEVGQSAKSILPENIFKMWARLLPGSESNACWYINKDCLPALMSMSLPVGIGGVAVYTPANAIAGTPYNTLMGRPVIPIEQASTVGTVGDIVLADLTGGYIIVEKGGVQTAMSIHLRFQYDESCFRFSLRADGMPVLASAITPANGSDSLGHFVALATRA
jgi:HK97 family phage major capsid protein